MNIVPLSQNEEKAFFDLIKTNQKFMTIGQSMGYKIDVVIKKSVLSKRIKDLDHGFSPNFLKSLKKKGICCFWQLLNNKPFKAKSVRNSNKKAYRELLEKYGFEPISESLNYFLIKAFSRNTFELSPRNQFLRERTPRVSNKPKRISGFGSRKGEFDQVHKTLEKLSLQPV